MKQPLIPMHGRGTSCNPRNRFGAPLNTAGTAERVPTQLFYDKSSSVVSFNNSPDVEFHATVNPYRGCEHGCVYCYARPMHEYLGMSAGLDFESKILVKTNAPELLRQTLGSPSWKPQTILFSGATDAYQPVESKLKLTRRCLEVMAEFRNPVSIITKNALVNRDKDVLAELAHYDAAKVYLSITTLDGELARRMEPRTCRPDLRLNAIRELRAAGVPVGVLVGPVIPGLTEEELPDILAAAAAAGASFAYYTLLRLPWGVKVLFEQWLEQHYPQRKKEVMQYLREARSNALSDHTFGERMTGCGGRAREIAETFTRCHEKHGMTYGIGKLSTAAFRRAGDKQLCLL